MTLTDATAPTKNHYVVLDGLRGVASLMVLIFHLFEAYSFRDPRNQVISHGGLAVDFFFMLSGFVIAYAYDDRWSRMSQWEFYKRRLIRLQPMIVMGTLIGAALFYFQAFKIYPMVESTQLWHVFAIMLAGFMMIPLPKPADVRGWNEMYPLNGPAWSLFYEYSANILYAVGLRKLPVWALGIFVAAAGAALIHFAISSGRGSLVGGWTLDPKNLQIGFIRVIFPFFAGVLLMRLGKRIHVRKPFTLCSALLVAALMLPRFGGTGQFWMNSLYDALCVILLFPLILAIGAGDKHVDGVSMRVARFFGDLSYPLYIIHYPLIYIYTGWAVDNAVPAIQGVFIGAGVLVITVVIAWVCLTLYDKPVRRWLGEKLLRQPNQTAIGFLLKLR